MARIIKNKSGFHSSGKNAKEKAAQFGAHAKEHGWTGEWAESNDGSVTLTAYRGDSEMLQLIWSVENKYVAGTHTVAGHTLSVHNPSAASVLVRDEPSKERLHTAVRRQRMLGTPIADFVVSPKRYADVADDELEKMLPGRRITWINGISKELHTTVVGDKKMLKVIRNGEKSQVHFTDQFGYRAVYLDAIVSIG